MSRDPLSAEHPLRPLADLLDREAELEDDGDGPARADLLEIDDTLAGLGPDRLQQLVLTASRLLFDSELEEVLPSLRSPAAELAWVRPDLRRPRPKA